jgi:hypothetical protein
MAASDNVLDISSYDHVDEAPPPAGLSPFDAQSRLQNALRRILWRQRIMHRIKKRQNRLEAEENARMIEALQQAAADAARMHWTSVVRERMQSAT